MKTGRLFKMDPEVTYLKDRYSFEKTYMISHVEGTTVYFYVNEKLRVINSNLIILCHPLLSAAQNIHEHFRQCEHQEEAEELFLALGILSKIINGE